MSRCAVVAVLSGLTLAVGACGAPAPPKLLPPRVASSVMPLPAKMAARVPAVSPAGERPRDAVGPGAYGSVRSRDQRLADQPEAAPLLDPSTSTDPCAGLTAQQCYGYSDPPAGATSDYPDPPVDSTGDETPSPTVTSTPSPPTSQPPTSSPPTATRTGSPTTSESPPSTTTSQPDAR
ncbi:hypothetical protein MOQ72_20455 [Saccharopolyspora sp. K220]|uniref:hypothetical protein n=1 Tax=Saccharopolyspora soli TaxID=2926618 RepID=UPI001F5A3F5E|nr:hypothetical protein [Saccharopolyspora soli]MCI2419821.1 hypothetical protein [Saccharopolyspora soli]